MRGSTRFVGIAVLMFDILLTNKVYGSDGSSNHPTGRPPEARTDHEPGNLAREAPAGTARPLRMAEQGSCPVCGKPVDRDFSVTHEGQKVYFASRRCIETFKNTPESYLVEVYLEVYPQQVQVKCPVTGNPIDPQVFTEFKGRRIYYCCTSCDRRFRADPDRYTAALTAAFTRQVHCPVTGELVDLNVRLSPTSPVLLCCKGCVSKFWQMDAEALRKAGEVQPEAGLLAHGLTIGEDLFVSLPDGQVRQRRRTHAVVHEGIRYAVDAPAFVETFKAQPDRYIQVLRNKMIELLGRKHALYACGEHPGIIQIGPGNCPVSGKHLVRIQLGNQSAPTQIGADRLRDFSASE